MKSKSDEQEEWSARYRTGQTGWDLGEPAPNLQQLVRQWVNPDARIVVPGCGRGHDARAFAAAGYDVTAMDIAPEAIGDASEPGLEYADQVHWLTGDMLEPRPDWEETFDAWVELTCFCAIDPTQRSAYVEQAWRWLRPGGLVVGVFFVGLPPGGPPFDSSVDELRQRFARFELLSLEPSSTSVPARAGMEWEGVFRKLPESGT